MVMMTALRTSIRRLQRICSFTYQASGCTRTLSTQTTLLKASSNGNSLISRNFHTSRIVLSQEKVSTNFHVQNKDIFKEKVLDSNTPTIVDFHADWCGPCKLLGPKLERAVDQHDGKILLAKVDIDKLSDIAMEYNVKVVPTVVGFKDGKDFSKFEGNLPEADIEAFLNKLLMK